MPGARISVRVQPRARREEVMGLRDDAWVVRVSAPALEGRANDAVCRLLAKRIGVPRSAVRVIRGERSPDKVIEVEGVDVAAVTKSLGSARGR